MGRITRWPKGSTLLPPSGSQGFRQATITTWLTRAGEHARTWHERCFCHLHLPHLLLRRAAHPAPLRHPGASSCGWRLIPAPALLPVLQLGSRTQHMAHAVIHSLRQMLVPGCLPLLTRDGLHLYCSALTAQFAHWLQVNWRGRKVLRWQVAAGLIYGQVKNADLWRKLVQVRHMMRLGTEDALTVALQGMGFGGAADHRF